jgi:hypothetical protein
VLLLNECLLFISLSTQSGNFLYTLVKQVIANADSVLLVPGCKHMLFAECLVKLYIVFEKFPSKFQTQFWLLTPPVCVCVCVCVCVYGGGVGGEGFCCCI